MTGNSDVNISARDSQDEHQDDIIGKEKVQAQHIEAAVYELNKIDLDQLSRDALTWKSRATLRLALCVLVKA